LAGEEEENCNFQKHSNQDNKNFKKPLNTKSPAMNQSKKPLGL
jgi:hypothetical protein